MRKGKLIVIEGTDCSGKETQANKVVEYLEYDPTQIMFYHFNMLKKSLDYGLRPLICDDAVVNFIKFVEKSNVKDFF